MASKLPLILRVDREEESGSSRIATFILGQTVKELEKAGYLTILPSIDHVAYYSPAQTKRINSFHIMKRRMSRDEIVQKMIPGEQIVISKLDSIGWGFEEPLVSITYMNLRGYR